MPKFLSEVGLKTLVEKIDSTYAKKQAEQDIENIDKRVKEIEESTVKNAVSQSQLEKLKTDITDEFEKSIDELNKLVTGTGAEGIDTLKEVVDIINDTDNAVTAAILNKIADKATKDDLNGLSDTVATKASQSSVNEINDTIVKLATSDSVTKVTGEVSKNKLDISNLTTKVNSLQDTLKTLDGISGDSIERPTTASSSKADKDDLKIKPM